MGFEYRPYVFRDGEVVSNDRVTQNMRALANKINGNLDRDNLPASSVAKESVKDETFNIIEFNDSTTPQTITGGGFKEVENVGVSRQLNEDAMVIGHFGCWYDWQVVNAPTPGTELETLLIDEGVSSGLAQRIVDRYINDESKSKDFSGGTDNLEDDWNYLREFFVDFEMRINGLIVAKSEFNSFFRKSFHISMVGCSPAPAGELDVKVYARLRRNVDGKFQDVDGLQIEVNSRSLILEIKQR